MPRLTQCAHCRLTRTHEIADGLWSLIWNPDRCQLTCAVQLGSAHPETVENLGVITPHCETDDVPNAPRQRNLC